MTGITGRGGNMRIFEKNGVVWGSFFVLVLAFLIGHIVEADVWLTTILKVMPSLVLTGAIVSTYRRHQRVLMLVTLWMNVAGDVLLNVDRTRFFMAALVCFLMAHVMYTALFARSFDYRSRARMIVLVGVLLFAACLAVALARTPAEFRVPVYAYLAIITVMASSAVVNRSLRLAVGIGAILFMVGDALIAINKFVVPIPSYTYVSIPIYFTAQIVMIHFYQRSMFADKR